MQSAKPDVTKPDVTKPSIISVEKTLAIMIRCHGSIPVYYLPDKPIHETMNLIRFNQYNISNLSIVGLSRLSRVCYGDSNIQQFIKSANIYYNTDIDLKKKSIETRIRELLLNARPPPKLNSIRNSIYGESTPPTLTNLKSHYIEKQYNKHNEHSGVFTLFSSGFTPDEIRQINQKLSEVTQKIILGEVIFRATIFDSLKEFNISKLYFCDFTCDAYSQYENYTLLESDASAITNFFEAEKLRGGKTKKYKNNKSVKQKKRNKSSKK